MSQLQDEQERRAKAAAAENAAFSAEFLGAARRVFAMIDVDNSGNIDPEEFFESMDEERSMLTDELFRMTPGQQKGATLANFTKAPISVEFHSFRLFFGRAIISRSGLEASMFSS